MSVETPSYTKLQLAEMRYQDWLDGGQTGEPPERPVFRDGGVSAMIDPFAQWDLGVVVYPHEAQAGQRADLWRQNTGSYLKVMLVARAVGLKILERTGCRPFSPPNNDTDVRASARADGFAVPDHPHIVLGAAPRGAEPVLLPTDAAKKSEELDRRWEALRITGPAEAALLEGLAIIDKAFAGSL